MRKLISFTRLFLFISFISFKAHAQKEPFTVADAIQVKSMGSQSLSDDGKYLAGIISDGSARFETDHFRFQDPSYLNVLPGEFVIIQTETGEQLRPNPGLSRVTSVSWSPTNKEIAFLEQQEDKLHLMIYDIGRKRKREIKISGSPLLANESLLWAPDGKFIYLKSREADWLEKAMPLYQEATKGPIVVYDGSEPFLKWDKIRNTNALTNILKVNPVNGVSEKILPESNYSQLNITEDGTKLIFTENFPLKTSYVRDKGTAYQVAYIELGTADSAKVIYKRNEKRRNFNWSDSKTNYAWVDSGYVFVRKLGSNDSINLTKGKAFEEEGKKKDVKFNVLSWSPDEKGLLLGSDKGFWWTDAQGESLELIYGFEEEKENRPELDLIKWSEDGRHIYFSYSAKKEWKRGFVKLDINEKQISEILLDTKLYTGVQFAKNGEKGILNLSDGDLPSDVVAVDLSFSSMQPLTDMNPWIKSKKLTRSELITYRNVDGKEMKGILYYPVDYEEGKKYPLVCEIYEVFFNNGYNRNMNLFANQNYFGLRPSVDLEMGYPGEAWVKGITSAINKLVDEGKVDNDKVGVQGGSYGGYATSLLITQTDRFTAAINISGKVNIISFLGDSPKIGTRNYTAAEYGQDRIGGTLWDEPLKYFATTAVLYADRIKTPHLILTGEGDWNVPGGNSRELYYAMRRLGKDVTWVNYLNGGHGAGAASNESDFHDHWKRVFDFYEKHFNKEKEIKKDKDDEN
ncbi:Dipeptidyl aminopeptidase/acylaminoacyl peptidase [Aquiflexum balticum DSM 16537]|uniref:Dipeptidyl aminopeptidase/acylaminoacyl peptidase n=1 Tax=Aquiflexum balticum DSM 16537 TaxID=758820 RepID=A0A1W2HBP0_9BACT|nr:prolyl oligopeptidase family serine peptidase [Aquiflexum balticum]SMD46148.1 Dipeptidyl aminopeptidase/acylaminoacyl peptidase [Aquiflexum balticum DSM 16537]